MSEVDGAESQGMRSLTQERIAIDRERVIGQIITGVCLAAIALGLVLVVGGRAEIMPGLGFVMLLPIGVVRLVRSRIRRLKFEATHGPDAGRQRPVGR